MFLGNTQKNELLDELKFLSLRGFTTATEAIKDIETNESNAECLDFTDPDNQQIGIKITDDVWLYSQQDKMDYDYYNDNDLDVKTYKTQTIELIDYDDDDIDDMVSAFYSDLDTLKKENGDSWKQITLECIFETYD